MIVNNLGIQEELGMQRNPSREKRKLPWLISMANAHRKSTDHRETRVNLS